MKVSPAVDPSTMDGSANDVYPTTSIISKAHTLPGRSVHAVWTLSLPCHYGAKTAPKGTKKALAVSAKCLICIACVVEPGGFEPPSASTPLSVLHA